LRKNSTTASTSMDRGSGWTGNCTELTQHDRKAFGCRCQTRRHGKCCPGRRFRRLRRERSRCSGGSCRNETRGPAGKRPLGLAPSEPVHCPRLVGELTGGSIVGSVGESGCRTAGARPVPGSPARRGPHRPASAPSRCCRCASDPARPHR
jgi:hypothetical protein